jgi:hypothetical protein
MQLYYCIFVKYKHARVFLQKVITFAKNSLKMDEINDEKGGKTQRTYSEQKEARRFIVLTLNCEILGIWGNLKKLCSEIKEKDSDFPSYWTLARKKENPIKFDTPKGNYIVSNEKPK